MNALVLCKYELLHPFDAFEERARDNFRKQLWWAGLRLGEAGPPPLQSRQKVQLINSQGWGGQVFAGVTLRGPQPRVWEEGTSSRGSQIKEDSPPGWQEQCASSHKGGSLQSPGAEISHQGSWGVENS